MSRQTALSRVSDLERHDTFVRSIGPVFHARRPAGIHAFLEKPVAVPLATFNNINFLPEVMNESLRTRAARIDFEHLGNEHSLRICREYLLIITRRCALHRRPGDVFGREKLKFRLRHVSSLHAFVPIGRMANQRDPAHRSRGVKDRMLVR